MKKIRKKVSQCRKKLKGGPFRIFNIHCCKTSKNWRGPFGGKKFQKKSHNAEKKLKEGTLWDFSASILSQNIKNWEGDPLGKKLFQKKSHNAENNWKPLVSPGIVCYAEKRKNLFGSVRYAKWFNLGPWNFVELSRTVLVSSCGLKKKVTILKLQLIEMLKISISVRWSQKIHYFNWLSLSKRRLKMENFVLLGYTVHSVHIVWNNNRRYRVS